MKSKVCKHGSLLAGTFCLLALVGCGGGGGGGGSSGTGTTEPTPSVRAVGTPTGAATEQTVGPAGGTVTAGALTLQIPAGALATDTNISITPITTTAPGGRAGFRLGPDGTTFSVPVTLTMTYTTADTNGSSEDFLGIAWQDATGVWIMPATQTHDTTNKTVSVQMTHFTDFSKVQGAQIRPPSASVKVNRTVQLVAKQCFWQKAPVTADNDLTPLVGIDCDSDTTPLPPTVSSWSVNGTAGGSAATGTVSGTQLGQATFTAPATKPNPNVVAVSARATMAPFGNTLLVSNITILDDTTRIIARGRYHRANTPLAPFVTADVVDEGVTFSFAYPLNSQEVVPWENNLGDSVSQIHDSRTGCINPTLSGGWDMLSATNIEWHGVYFNVIGTWSHGAVTYGVGEGNCAVDTVTQAAATGDFIQNYTLPAEFFGATLPTMPFTQADPISGWTWTYDADNAP